MTGLADLMSGGVSEMGGGCMMEMGSGSSLLRQKG